MGADAPNYVRPSISGTPGGIFNFAGQKLNYGGTPGLPGGKELEDYSKSLLENGLPADIRANYLKQGLGQIAGNLASGEENLKESLAAQGGAPIAASIGGEAALRNNANQADNQLNANLANMNFDAKQKGFGDYTNLINLAQGGANAQNQYDMSKFQADQSGSFDPGSFFGQLGSAGLAKAPATCFCYAEAFGTSSREFVKARELSRFCDEQTKRGYMKLSTILIPLMRKNLFFKKIFRRFALHVLKGMVKKNLSLIVMKWLCKRLGVLKLNNKELSLLNTVWA